MVNLYVRRLSIGKLHGKDAERPDIGFAVVLFCSPNQFRWHPADGANLLSQALLILCQLCCVVESSQLDLACLVNEEIVRLDISVDYVPLVEVDEAFQSPIETIFAKAFWNFYTCLFKYCSQITALHVVSIEPITRLEVVSMMALHKYVTFCQLVHGDLLHCPVFLVLVFRLNHCQSDFLTIMM